MYFSPNNYKKWIPVYIGLILIEKLKKGMKFNSDVKVRVQTVSPKDSQILMLLYADEYEILSYWFLSKYKIAHSLASFSDLKNIYYRNLLKLHSWKLSLHKTLKM